MNTLHVLYDADSRDSVQQRDWLARQAAIVPLRFHAHCTEETSCRFPGIEPHLTRDALTTVSDDGHFWTGPNALVTCLFALEAHRDLGERLAQPEVLPLARTALELLRREVFELNQLLHRSDPAELKQVLQLNSDIVRKHFRLPPPALPAHRA